MVSIKTALVHLFRFKTWPRGLVNIGSCTTGTPYVISDPDHPVTIGKFCSIGPEVFLIPTRGHVASSENRNFRVSTNHLARLSPYGFKSSYCLPKDFTSIKVGNDVWIGARATILAEVTVGDGAIIGAGAVVTKNVPPYAIVTGVPAKITSYRYSKEQIAKLLKIAWWDWPIEKISNNMDLFYGDIETFIKKFEV